jgi:hypothetical protein
MSRIRNYLSPAKRQDGILQGPHAGVPQGCGGGIEAAKLPDQRRDTDGETVCRPRRPGEHRFGVHPCGAGIVIVNGPPTMAVLPSSESDTEEPCSAGARPTAPVPTSFAPCCVHAPPERGRCRGCRPAQGAVRLTNGQLGPRAA